MDDFFFLKGISIAVNDEKDLLKFQLFDVSGSDKPSASFVIPANNYKNFINFLIKSAYSMQEKGIDLDLPVDLEEDNE